MNAADLKLGVRQAHSVIDYRGCATRLRRNTQRACANRTSPDEADMRDVVEPAQAVARHDGSRRVQRTGLRQKRAPALECTPARAQSATTSIS
jgi:hypothetical protein